MDCKPEFKHLTEEEKKEIESKLETESEFVPPKDFYNDPANLQFRNVALSTIATDGLNCCDEKVATYYPISYYLRGLMNFKLSWPIEYPFEEAHVQPETPLIEEVITSESDIKAEKQKQIKGKTIGAIVEEKSPYDPFKFCPKKLMNFKLLWPMDNHLEGTRVQPETPVIGGGPK